MLGLQALQLAPAQRRDEVVADNLRVAAPRRRPDVLAGHPVREESLDGLAAATGQLPAGALVLRLAQLANDLGPGGRVQILPLAGAVLVEERCNVGGLLCHAGPRVGVRLAKTDSALATIAEPLH